MSNTEARRYFLSKNAYCAFDLPSYFDFAAILQSCREKLAGKDYSHLIKEGDSPRNYIGVNYAIIHNKNGAQDWRKLQLIHPMIYTGLTNILTNKANWKLITSRFAELHCEKIACTSIPVVVKRPPISDPECAIKNWSDNLVDRNINLSCEYNFLIKTDIANCYDSVHTNTIVQAIHGPETAKERQDDPKLLGNQLARIVQDMTFGSGGGIPQGSILSDLLMELILGYLDTLIQEQLYHHKINKVQILRYRDDYHIYTHDQNTAGKVLKILTEKLAVFNFRINQAKTVEVNDIILAGWKPDKFAWLKIEDKILDSNLTLKNRLLLLKEHSVLFPNCSSLRIGLSKLYLKSIAKMRREPRDLEGTIAILADIMCRNPGAYPICTAILIKLLKLLKDESRVAKCLRMIAQKFEIVTHTEHFYIWLQRLTLGISAHYRYSSPICALLYNKDTKIWNSEWLLPEVMDDSRIINETILDNLPALIPPEEVCLFNLKSGSG